jgi:hypothetical protein
MLPVGSCTLRRIGRTVDVMSFVSRFTRSRIAAAFGPMAAALEHLAPAVDAQLFHPARRPNRVRPPPTQGVKSRRGAPTRERPS